MQRWLFLAATGVIFAIMALAVAVRALSGGGEQAGGWRGEETLVSAYTVQPEVFADVVEALGTAGANESVNLTAKVSDIIARLDFDSGARVEECVLTGCGHAPQFEQPDETLSAVCEFVADLLADSEGGT